MPLLTTGQLAALSVWAEQGMTTAITIQRLALADSDYGDDETLSYVTVGTTTGWFRSTPTPVATAGTGALITVNTYRLLVPTDTDILPKDLVLVGDETYIVTDTTAESTWKVYLTVSLRRRE